MKCCVLCGTDRNSTKIAANKQFGWDIMYCDRCKLGYALEDNKIIKRSYKKFYQKDYWHTKAGKSNIYSQSLNSKLMMAGIKFLRAIGIHPLIAISHYDMMKEYAPEGKFLEIGPGEGYSLRFFNKKFDVKAIEPDITNTNNINAHFNRKICKNGDSETDRLDGKYDVIYMSHVFEHLVSPKEFLRKIKSNMSNNGIIFIEIPNCECPPIRKSSVENETHIYHYTLSSINMLFKKEGFKILNSGVYDTKSKSILVSTWKSIFRIPDYEKSPLKKGMKIVLIAQKNSTKNFSQTKNYSSNL